MRNEVGKLLNAYYQCLKTIPSVNVYQVMADAEDEGNYILLRAESETDASNKSSFVTNPIVVMDIVTRHEGAIDASVVDTIDNQARQLLFPTRKTIGLPAQSGIQILNVRAESSTYLDGFDGSVYEHRKITRFFNRINQQ